MVCKHNILRPKYWLIKMIKKLVVLTVVVFTIFPLFAQAEGIESNYQLARKVASEGIILLENNGVLPLEQDSTVAVFGTGQLDYLHIGTGSGFVDAVYTVNLIDGLRNNHVAINSAVADAYADFYEKKSAQLQSSAPKGGPPGSNALHVPEMPLPEALLASAASQSDIAIYTFNRPSGEGSDRVMEGDYLLTSEELAILASLKNHFKKVVVVLNVSGLVDFDWLDSVKPDAVLLAWLPGMEGGNAMSDILTGTVTPSGKLTDTVALDYKDYPSSLNFGGFVDGYESVVSDGTAIDYWGFIPNHKTPPKGTTYKRPVGNRYYVEYEEDIFVGYRYFETFNVPVRYPFGYGLSYTKFDIEPSSPHPQGNKISIDVKVSNTGKRAGKEVVQIYYKAPDGQLEKPSRALVTFAKTKLLQPKSSQLLTMSFNAEQMASYDEEKAAWILEKGSYDILVGNSVKNLKKAGSFHVDETHTTRKLSNQLTLQHPESFKRLSKFQPEASFPDTPAMRAKDLGSPPPGPGGQSKIIFDSAKLKRADFLLQDVVSGKVDIDHYINQFSDLELIALLVGPGMGSTQSIFGEFSSFVKGSAGQTVTLERLGLPSMILADGPAGVRLEAHTTGFPVGTVVASTWNIDLARELGQAVGHEARLNGVDLWLAPSLNIHRNPLNGRNFEYYSEDPIVSGEIAAAVTQGVQEEGVGVTLKHLVANNQESNRFDAIDTVVSERALREIYLKGFEIAVTASEPWAIMTSYNSVNGTYTAASHDLITEILRNEWGFDGIVMTDWEGDGVHSITALHAGNNLFMPGFPGQIAHFQRALADHKITRSELETAAKPIIEKVIKSVSYEGYVRQ